MRRHYIQPMVAVGADSGFRTRLPFLPRRSRWNIARSRSTRFVHLCHLGWVLSFCNGLCRLVFTGSGNSYPQVLLLLRHRTRCDGKEEHEKPGKFDIDDAIRHEKSGAKRRGTHVEVQFSTS